MKGPDKYLLFSYPLEAILALQATGILIAHSLPFHISPAVWVVLAIYLTALCLLLRKASHKSVSLLLASLTISICVTSLHIAREQEAEGKGPQVYTAQQLPAIDHLKLKAQRLRSHTARQYQRLHIKDQEYALISAMTLGDKTALSQATKADYSSSGASHVLAVSGLHIGIIFQLFVLLLGGHRHFLPTLLALLSIWAYVLFIGLPASALRSALMISLYCLASMARRQGNPLHNLTLAAIIMLLWKPRYLFDVSFQMSFMAVLFILVIHPHRGAFFPENRIPRILLPLARWSWGVVMVSLAAQIGTMPIVAHYFGQVSCFSILSSFVAIPSATLILYLCVGVAACSPLPALQATLASWVGHVAHLCNHLLSLIAHLPGACIQGIKINILQVGLLYVVLIAGCLLIHKLHRYCLRRSRPSASGRDYSPRARQTLPWG